MIRGLPFLLLGLVACEGSEPAGPATPAAVPVAPPAPPPKPPEPAPVRDDAGEISARVVRDVGGKALGGQVIDPACVQVTVIPAGTWTIAAARLGDCGSKTARSIVWLYKRQTGAWNEDYVGQPPKCWKGVPADIAPAVKLATKIPTC